MYLQTTRYISLLLSERVDRTCVQPSKETSITGHITLVRVSRSDTVPIVEPVKSPCRTNGDERWNCESIFGDACVDSDRSRALSCRLGSIGDGRSKAQASSLPPGAYLRCRRDPRATQQCLCTWCGFHNRGRLELSGVLRASPHTGGCGDILVFSTYRSGPAP